MQPPLTLTLLEASDRSNHIVFRDSRIPALIRNGLQEKKRSFFVVVGDHSKDAIVKLHFIMSQADLRQNKSVLWAYKNKLLGFTSHRKKRENKIKKEIKRGIRDANTEDPFELFVSLHDVRYVYYKETDKILGRTFGMVRSSSDDAIHRIHTLIPITSVSFKTLRLSHRIP